jgi:hypothetical protein
MRFGESGLGIEDFVQIRKRERPSLDRDMLLPRHVDILAFEGIRGIAFRSDTFAATSRPCVLGDRRFLREMLSASPGLLSEGVQERQPEPNVGRNECRR